MVFINTVLTVIMSNLFFLLHFCLESYILDSHPLAQTRFCSVFFSFYIFTTPNCPVKCVTIRFICVQCSITNNSKDVKIVPCLHTYGVCTSCSSEHKQSFHFDLIAQNASKTKIMSWVNGYNKLLFHECTSLLGLSSFSLSL